MNFPNIPDNAMISLDYETSGLRYWLPDFTVFGAAIAIDDQSWYWDFRDHPNAVQFIKDLLRNKRKVAAQNAQYEVQCSRQLGIDVRDVDWYCTMVNETL